MFDLHFKEYVAALKEAGLVRGDCVFVTSRLFAFGSVEVLDPTVDEKNALLDFYYRGLREVIGAEGTVVVITSFEDYARFATPFIRESSPSRTGIFTEYVRTLPGSMRSIHPIMSLCANGPLASRIGVDSHFDAFGWSGPWGELHRMNAKMLMLGLGISGGGVFAHYAEQLYGVPYQYNKVYDTPVYSGGKEVHGVFSMNVRYLDFGIQNTFEAVDKYVDEEGLVRRINLGRSFLTITDADTIVKAICACLDRNRWSLLVQPPAFRKGQIPFDGSTGAMKKVYFEPRKTEDSGPK